MAENTPAKDDKAGSESTSAVEKKDSGQKVAMVSILSWRTALVVGLGGVLGIIIALVYWLVSPSINLPSGEGSVPETSMTTENVTGVPAAGLLGLLGIEHTGAYESKVKIQIVSPGSEYIPLASLQQYGEYYAAKANSLPFFNFLVRELEEKTPEVDYDVDTLDQAINTEYDYKSEIPSITITVAGKNAQEAAILVELIPQTFRDYLAAEQREKRQKEYQDTLEEIDIVKAALYEAEQQLSSYIPYEISNNPQYILLNAKLEALERELDAQLGQLTQNDSEEIDVEQEYNNTLQQISLLTNELAQAEQELRDLEPQDVQVSDYAERIIIEAKVRALQNQLDKLLDGYVDPETETQVVGLAEMIADGVSSGADYENMLEKVETVSLALAQAKTELDTLNSRLDSNLEISLDYRIAQIKVDTIQAELPLLQAELARLYNQMRNLGNVGYNGDPQEDFERTAMALKDVKDEIAQLESELGYDRLAADLDYNIAQDKVNNLNVRLDSLTVQLGSLVGEESSSSNLNYLVAGKPTIPFPLLPERPRASNTLIMGAIAGIVIAWVILNYKWIWKVLSSSDVSKRPDEENN